MAVPRPVMLAILGLALVAGAFLATRSGSNESVTQATKAPEKPAPAQSIKPASPPARHAPTHKLSPITRVPSQTVIHRARPAVHADAEIADGAEAAAKALSQGNVVVFFFTKPGTAEDSATAQAVGSLRGMKKVAVIKANLADIAAYRPMLANVGISQVPAVVVARPGNSAVLFQGFVDAGTLRQNVADALR